MIDISLDGLLESYRRVARTERGKGTYFERLASAFLSEHPVQREHYQHVQGYADWAADQRWERRDTRDLPKLESAT